MSGWDGAAEEARKAEAERPSIFFKLKTPGETAVVAFVGDVKRRDAVYVDGTYKDYDPQVHTELQPQPRWKVNVFVIAYSPTGEDDAWQRKNLMQIAELSNATFVQIADNRERFPLDRFTYRIKRATQNRYDAGPYREITQELVDLIDKATLHDLDQQGGGSGGGEPQGAGSDAPY